MGYFFNTYNNQTSGKYSTKIKALEVGGFIFKLVNDTNKGNTITKLDRCGTVVWSKIITITNASDLTFNDIINSDNNSIIILGASHIIQKCIIIKLTTEGNIIWKKSTDLNNYSHKLVKINAKNYAAISDRGFFTFDEQGNTTNAFLIAPFVNPMTYGHANAFVKNNQIIISGRYQEPKSRKNYSIIHVVNLEKNIWKQLFLFPEDTQSITEISFFDFKDSVFMYFNYNQSGYLVPFDIENISERTEATLLSTKINCCSANENSIIFNDDSNYFFKFDSKFNQVWKKYITPNLTLDQVYPNSIICSNLITGDLGRFNLNLDSCKTKNFSEKIVKTKDYVTFQINNPSLYYFSPNPSNSIDISMIDVDCSKGEICSCNENLQNKECNTLFHQVEWLSENDHQYNIHIPSMESVQQDNKATIEGLTKYIQPIWRPDTLYRIKYNLKDNLQYNGKTKEHLFSVAYGFKTAGPLGHFHTDPNSAYGNIIKTDGTSIKESLKYPDKYPHASLKQYIDYQRSYPNPDGNIINAKPLFYGDKTTEIRLHFTHNYMQQMFDGWKEYNGLSALSGLFKIIIKDPAEDTEIVNPPRLDVDIEYQDIPQTEESWVNDEDPRIPAEVQQWINLAKANTCNLELGEMIVPPKCPLKIVKPKCLKPQKLYTAQVLNFYWKDAKESPESLSGEDLENFKKKYSQEVHKFVFQTSRYKDFEEQVSSCLLKDDANNSRLAEFSLKKELSQKQIDAISEEATVFFNSSPANNLLSKKLEDQYPNPFERIMHGILELNPLDTPIGTEFNKIINSQTGELIALLIRNPEPLNHPKIPLLEIQNTVQVLNEEGLENTSYKTLFSKDYSQTLIVRPKQTWDDKPITIRFSYKHWTGREYETISYGKTLKIENSTIINQIIIN